MHRELTNQLNIYIHSQKRISSLFIVQGVVFLLAALAFYFLGTSSLSRGFMIGMLVCGTLIFLGGITYRISQHNILTKNLKQIHTEVLNVKLSEEKRMKKVMQQYPLYQLIFGIMLFSGALTAFLFTNPFWKGIGFSVMLLYIIIMIIEGFSLKSITKYHCYLSF